MKHALLVLATSCSLLTAQAQGGAANQASAEIFTLPGEAVFPEGIGVNHATGDFFVGNTQDGTVYKGNARNPGELEVFLEPGSDGRTAVSGLRVDDQGRLFVAGWFTGRAFVYDAESGDLIKALETPAAEQTVVNDVTFAGDAAYFIDSYRPIIFRVSRTANSIGDLEPWLDLTGTAIQYSDGFNLSGVTASDDGRYLVAVQENTGTFYRIDTETKEVRQIDLGGETFVFSDGLLLDGQTLFVVRSDPGVVHQLALSQDLLRGEVVRNLDDPSLRFPTSAAEFGGRLLVVNSQLNAEPGGVMTDQGVTAELPFTVSSLPVQFP